MRVKDFMSTSVTTISPTDTVHVGDGVMSLGEFRHLPVMDGKDLVGVLTERDVLRAPAVMVSARGVVEAPRAAAKGLLVQDLMSTTVVTVGPETTLAEAARRLLAYRIGCLPVLETGRLVGMLTRSDLIRALAQPARSGTAGTTGPHLRSQGRSVGGARC